MEPFPSFTLRFQLTKRREYGEVCDGQSPQKIKDLGALQIVCWIFGTNVGAGLGHDLSQFVTSNIDNLRFLWKWRQSLAAATQIF